MYTQKANTLRNRSVCPSGRLHDNFWKKSPIMMKFSAQFRLNNTSVEFEDEKDWASRSWVIAKILIFSYGLLCENQPILAFVKNFFYHNQRKPQLLNTIR